MPGSWYDVHEQTEVSAKGRRKIDGRKENTRHPGEEPI